MAESRSQGRAGQFALLGRDRAQARFCRRAIRLSHERDGSFWHRALR